MKSPFVLRAGVFAVALSAWVTTPAVGLADDLTPPVVLNKLPNVVVGGGTKKSVVNIKSVFGLSGVTGTIVRMATVAGNIDIELLDTETPKNVANFLTYVNNGNYNKSFMHRLEPGFVVQGGGYYVGGDGKVDAIPTNSAVPGEHVRSNTRGTLALALSSGPDSGTNQWFFNLTDNNGANGSVNLDTAADGGPFTVFGRVVESDMTTVDAIAALPEFDFSSSLGAPFTNLPLFNYNAAAGASIDNLVFLNDVAVIPVIADTPGADAVLSLKVKNNNPGLVTATIVGRKLKLVYVQGNTGVANIKVLATDSTGTQTKSKFTVTVQ